MDLRVLKTKNSIKKAFFELRSRKPLEKITVKELCEAAMINKATFYLHYKDIFDLADSLENEFIEQILSTIPEEATMDTEAVVTAIVREFYRHDDMVGVLFSGNRLENVIKKTDRFVRNEAYKLYPEVKDNLEFNMRLTATIHGCFNVYFLYKDGNDEEEIIANLVLFVKRCMD